MLVSGSVLALYFWVFFAGIESVTTGLLVSDMTAVLAGTAFVFGFITYLWVPKNRIEIFACINYLILIGVIASLIANTGYLASPFIALWIIVSVFAPLFRWVGVSAILSMVLLYIVQSLVTEMLATSEIITLILVAILPVAIGLIMQAQLSKAAERRGESAYSRLASELSSVEGMSEVVIAAIADGVIALDGNGIIELINPAAERILGWGKSDALKLDYKSVLKLYDNRDKAPDTTNDPIYQSLSTNQQTHSESMSLAALDTNKKFLTAITVSPLGDEKNGVIVVFRDISREKADEREQAEFISTASHEMRTPVASIEGYLGLALNTSIAQVDDKARDFITKAQASAQHLGRLFQDLLDVSRVDDGRLNSSPRVIDVVQLIHDIAQGLLMQAQQKDIRVDYKPRPDLYDEAADSSTERTLTPIYYADVDNDHLREVISNLIENAIKYTLRGSIEIDVTGDNTHIIISVTDSGIGIPGADIPHLFQKFYRVDDTDTREIGGTGLGLYLSRKLVESMHGKIWVESTYQKGSTFYVQLPRLENAKAKQKIELMEIAKPAVEPVIATISTAQTITEAPVPPPAIQRPVAAPEVAQRMIHDVPVPVAPVQPPLEQPNVSAQPYGSTSRPSLDEMSPQPRAIEPLTPSMAIKQRQNIPITTIEANSNDYVRQPNDTHNAGQQ